MRGRGGREGDVGGRGERGGRVGGRGEREGVRARGEREGEVGGKGRRKGRGREREGGVERWRDGNKLVQHISYEGTEGEWEEGGTRN